MKFYWSYIRWARSTGVECRLMWLADCLQIQSWNVETCLLLVFVKDGKKVGNMTVTLCKQIWHFICFGSGSLVYHELWRWCFICMKVLISDILLTLITNPGPSSTTFKMVQTKILIKAHAKIIFIVIQWNICTMQWIHY